MAGHGAELASALGAVSTSIKAIATRVARAGLEGLYGVAGTTGGSGDAQKKLDVVANDIMKAQLAACGAVGVLASEEEDGALVLGDGRQA
ncbi:fructose-1,6-bisphosphatase I [Monoraphidium neglectum]|uniref:fructose-bisphosphatase n=1 Tax=Monoraphidium neglectum TaxID=145388 RepID=A0A0D2KAI1_9CHLO|nr:fructose-1,6-bisphosphatase I [Monoraphidium neglectum]KIY93033.1 fructose-1,6-bisphosphatase I [Monoraphidium neglectum]|eukprot:XP_013892053.1 fructose-1,6-bisphosphatase I [Monoraphidium neglectum]